MVFLQYRNKKKRHDNVSKKHEDYGCFSRYPGLLPICGVHHGSDISVPIEDTTQ
jgi:hypothetical protein